MGLEEELKKVADKLEPLLKKKDYLNVSDEEMDEIREVRVPLYGFETKEAKELLESTGDYLMEVYSARDEWYHERYYELTIKLSQGGNLTEEEARDMAKCSRVISDSH